MISMRRRYKVYIVIGIILLSIYFGLNRSNLLDVVKKSGGEQAIDLSTVQKEFDAFRNFTKYRFSYDAQASEQAMADLEGILRAKYSVAVKDSTQATEESPVIRKEEQVGEEAKVIIAILPFGIRETVLQKIEALPGMKLDGYENHEESLLNTEQQIADLEYESEILRKDANDTRYYNTKTQILDSLRVISKKIDQLKREPEMFRQRQEEPALLFVVRHLKGGQQSVTKQGLAFFKNFLISFLGITFLFFLVYFALALILRLMSYFGIRTSKSSGSGYGGYYKYNSRYGYGSYGGSYGSYGRRRKVKRVYKNHEGETVETSEEEKKQ